MALSSSGHSSFCFLGGLTGGVWSAGRVGDGDALGWVGLIGEARGVGDETGWAGLAGETWGVVVVSTWLISFGLMLIFVVGPCVMAISMPWLGWSATSTSVQYGVAEILMGVLMVEVFMV